MELTRVTAAVLRALRERDENTFAHCNRTRELCMETGRTFGLSADELAVLRWAAELHDIGKVGIPDRILFKPARLDAEEQGRKFDPYMLAGFSRTIESSAYRAAG